MVSLNYAPEPTGFGRHVSALAELVASHGHQVTVLTGFPFSPRWRRWPEYRGRRILCAQVSGVDVIRASHFVPWRPGSALQRIWMEASFCVMAAIIVSTRLRRRPDVVLYCGAQPSLAMFARGLARWWRTPYVVSIQDLAARAAWEVGTVRSSWLNRLLERFEFAAYSKADCAMVLCDAFRDALLATGYPADRIRTIHPPIDVDHIRPIHGSTAFRARNDLAPDDFVVLYSGSMGLKQGLTNVVEAARLLATSRHAIKWVLIGDGELRATLEALIQKYELGRRVRLLPLQHEATVPTVLASADVLLLNQLTTVQQAVLPSKLLTYMAAGKPILAAVNAKSQGAMLLHRTGGGRIILPGDPAALAAAVEALAEADRTLLDEMGALNRGFAERYLDQKYILAEQESLLLQVVKGLDQSVARA